MIRKNAVFACSAMPHGRRKRKVAEIHCYEWISPAHSPRRSPVVDFIRRKASAFLRASFHEKKTLLQSERRPLAAFLASLSSSSTKVWAPTLFKGLAAGGPRHSPSSLAIPRHPSLFPVIPRCPPPTAPARCVCPPRGGTRSPSPLPPCGGR